MNISKDYMILSTSYSDMTVEQLRDAGYAVCLFTPEECRGADLDRVEGAMCMAGFDAIDILAEEEEEEEGEAQS